MKNTVYGIYNYVDHIVSSLFAYYIW